ncbi:hypothetical protein CNR22_16360 [Sphingobacteriaceae bacterium]|nr:hypothetical protein CNR22_16360 [Sphingobacteriaceae bacterium]
MKKFLVLVVSFLCTLSHAQKNVGLVYGDFNSLSDQTSIAVKIDFDSLKVAGYGNENEFVAKMKQRFEENKKGGGAKWEANWTEKRTFWFERRFKTLFYKYTELDSLATYYCFIVRPTKLHAGFDTDDETPSAFLSGEVYLIRIAEPNKILAKLFFRNMRGEGVVADPTGGLRIGDTFAVAGKQVGKFVKSSIRKNKKTKR